MFWQKKYFVVVTTLIVVVSLLGCSKPVAKAQVANPTASSPIHATSSIALPSPGTISGKVTEGDG